MKRLVRRFRIVTVWLACLGWLMPLPGSGTAESANPGAGRAVYDVRLGEDGSFNGRLLDPTGTPLPGQTILLRQADNILARSRSDDRGEFSFKRVRGGVYQVTIGASAVACRAWTKPAAPPSATGQLAIVTRPEIIR